MSERQAKMREMEDAIGLKDDPGGGALSMGQLRAIERNEVGPSPLSSQTPRAPEL